MAQKKKTALFWSGGKDSAYALHSIQQEHPDVQIVCLITTLNTEFRRISMHGVREELLDRQAGSIGLPLRKMWVATAPDNKSYEEELHSMLSALKHEGIENVVFGDIFLEDLKLYRDNILKQHGLAGVYPLWKQSTSALINDFISKEFKTVVCCISTKYLDEQWAGREIDDQFIAELPATIDPCGENGEFHTFCFAGPIFSYPVLFRIGEKKYQPLIIKQSAEPAEEVGFWYADLLPASS